MSLETGDVRDIESLNKPDDSAHGAYNATTLKNADDLDEDGHVKRTGDILLQCYCCRFIVCLYFGCSAVHPTSVFACVGPYYFACTAVCVACGLVYGSIGA